MKIFEKCIELGVSSIAIPTIGAGKHGYREDIVLNIIKEEVKKISQKNDGHMSLKNVSLIVFKEKRKEEPRSLLVSNSLQQLRLDRVLEKRRPSVSPKTPPDTISTMPGGSTGQKFGSVNIVLKEGDITQQKADAVLNVLPKSLKLCDGGGVCGSILKTGGQIVQGELDTLRKESSLGPIFLTSAGDIPNVKKIIHFVPTTTDAAGLQNSIEQCFYFAQQNALSHLLIPAIGTANFNITPRNSANLILNAAKKFSCAKNFITLEIVIFLKKLLPDFQKAIEDQIEELPQLVGLQNSALRNTDIEATDSLVGIKNFLRNKDIANDPGKPASVAEQKCGSQSDITSIGTVEEIQIHFIGFKENIEDAISDTKAFVSGNKVEKSIEDIGDILQQYKSQVEKLSKNYRVLIKSSTSKHFALEGMKDDVAEFLVKFAELQMRHFGNSIGM